MLAEGHVDLGESLIKVIPALNCVPAPLGRDQLGADGVKVAEDQGSPGLEQRCYNPHQGSQVKEIVEDTHLQQDQVKGL